MHVRTQRRQNLRHLHPAILFEIRGDNLIGVLDVAAREKRHSLCLFNTKSALEILQLSAQRRDGVHPLCLRPAILLRPTPPARRSRPTSAMDHSKTVLHANQRTTAPWMCPALYGGSRRQTAGSLRMFRMTSGRCPRRGGNFGSAARGSADMAIKGR